MNDPQFSGPDPARTRLRATIATVERELALLPGAGAGDGGVTPRARLLASWADLVDQLQLGPEPPVRECPVCRHIGMRAATLCGYCWTKLTPPDLAEEGG
ncbi:MAG TPA: hypothetical protein VK698_34150 [Kofleriaceae bacterium]|nr:hypothetical protein [Kofleriaceae bacterium]